MSTIKSSSENLTLNADGAGNDVVIQGNGTNTATITAEGLLKYNSGYGSVATAYGCRAWVNFNGKSTVAIRDSGNVSSITDEATGRYTVNFTTAMPDANYSVAGTSDRTGGTCVSVNTVDFTTTTLEINTRSGSGVSVDEENISVTIFR
tara:strand:+ start:1135 stop:1581 length:447 start_codon:yes stop_codon:yes gene_type:complete